MSNVPATRPNPFLQLPSEGSLKNIERQITIKSVQTAASRVLQVTAVIAIAAIAAVGVALTQIAFPSIFFFTLAPIAYLTAISAQKAWTSITSMADRWKDEKQNYELFHVCKEYMVDDRQTIKNFTQLIENEAFLQKLTAYQDPLSLESRTQLFQEFKKYRSNIEAVFNRESFQQLTPRQQFYWSLTCLKLLVRSTEHSQNDSKEVEDVVQWIAGEYPRLCTLWKHSYQVSEEANSAEQTLLDPQVSIAKVQKWLVNYQSILSQAHAQLDAFSSHTHSEPSIPDYLKMKITTSGPGAMLEQSLRTVNAALSALTGRLQSKVEVKKMMLPAILTEIRVHSKLFAETVQANKARLRLDQLQELTARLIHGQIANKMFTCNEFKRLLSDQPSSTPSTSIEVSPNPLHTQLAWDPQTNNFKENPGKLLNSLSQEGFDLTSSPKGTKLTRNFLHFLFHAGQWIGVGKKMRYIATTTEPKMQFKNASDTTIRSVPLFKLRYSEKPYKTDRLFHRLCEAL